MRLLEHPAPSASLAAVTRDARQRARRGAAAITWRARSRKTSPSGMHPDEARRRARRALAGVQQRNEECRDARGLNLVDNFAQDLRFAGTPTPEESRVHGTAVLMIGLGMARQRGDLSASSTRHSSSRCHTRTPSAPQCHRAQESDSARQPFISRLPRLETAERPSLSSFDVHNGRGYMLRTPSGTELVGGCSRERRLLPHAGRSFQCSAATFTPART